MSSRIEITLKPELADAEGQGLRSKARNYFGVAADAIRTIHILTIDADLSGDQLNRVQAEIFTNPVTQISSLEPLAIDCDWIIWVGFRPGVRDNAGATAMEAMTDLLGVAFKPGEAVYTSKRYCLKGADLNRSQVERIASELLANDIIQQWKVFSRSDWDPAVGIGTIIPKVRLDHNPTVTVIPIESDESLKRISDQRNLALNPNDIPTIRDYFLNPDVLRQRAAIGLSDPTDVELEYISQARSDHCNHNTFQGLFRYVDAVGGGEEIIDSLFKTCIQAPTLELKEQKSWVMSVLWDNAGVGRFDDDHYYVITGETHNSPSNMEAYGGAITGIVGIYRDPMGTGRGSKLIMGSYGYCVGPRDYQGDLTPRLHPRRLLDGIIEGVRDTLRSGPVSPWIYGQVPGLCHGLGAHARTGQGRAGRTKDHLSRRSGHHERRPGG
jgi:phosphoribosylformylglycinamidine (FGAM) synthase PurS component